MQRVMFAFAAVLVAGLGFAQEGPPYTPAKNPFQGEYAFGAGRPVELWVDVEGVRLDAVTVSPIQSERPQERVQCDVQLTGNSAAKKKASLTTILLLEDAKGRGIEKIQLVPFKVKAGKPFDEKQRLTVGGDALAGAMKVYVFVQVGF